MTSKNKEKLNINYQELNMSIIQEHNKIRTNPKSYIQILEEQIKYIRDGILYKPNDTPIQTNEGITAYDEAIKFLQKQEPLPELIYDENLTKAATDHLLDIAPKGLVSHEGSDGKNVSDRIEKYCEWEVTCAENIDFGSKTGEDVVLSLLVDDGIKTRGHRANLFKADAKFVGVASGEHKEYETCVVIDMVGNTRPIGKPFYDIKNYKYQYPEGVNDTLEEKKKRKEEAILKRKEKNIYQRDDEDAPDGTVSVRITKSMTLFENKVRRVTKKFYKLEDGSEYIVEVEDAY
jgi:uncharacterized protein YkwD